MLTPDILLVEDNADHAELVIRALEKSGEGKVIWVRDGEEALEYLSREEQHAPTVGRLPGLILLDLNLPKVSGLEVLRRVKQNERLRTIPIVVLTTSDREEEVLKSYELGANSFVMKPIRFAEFAEEVRRLEEYWMRINRHPSL